MKRFTRISLAACAGLSALSLGGPAMAQDASDILRQDLSATDARAAQAEGLIVPLLDVRLTVRETFDVVQFYNARLLADEDGEPVIYCLPIEVWGGALVTVHVNPYSGEIFPDQAELNNNPESPCKVATDKSYARPGG